MTSLDGLPLALCLDSCCLLQSGQQYLLRPCWVNTQETTDACSITVTVPGNIFLKASFWRHRLFIGSGAGAVEGFLFRLLDVYESGSGRQVAWHRRWSLLQANRCPSLRRVG